MNIEKVYYDIDGLKCNILEMVKQEPYWAAVRIQEGEKAIEELNKINEWCRTRFIVIEQENKMPNSLKECTALKTMDMSKYDIGEKE